MRTRDFDAAPEIVQAEVMLFGIVKYSLWQFLRVMRPAAKLTGKSLQNAPGFITIKSWMPKRLTVISISFWHSAEALHAYAECAEHRAIQAWARDGNVKAASFRVFDAQSHGYTLGEWLARRPAALPTENADGAAAEAAAVR
jgi:heme-degrading monooxygenase HmoA